MKTYIYPENLRATVKLWFWNVRDFLIICGGIILSVALLAKLWTVIPLAVTVCYAFLSLRADDSSIMDYIVNAVKFFVTSQQIFLWEEGYEKFCEDNRYWLNDYAFYMALKSRFANVEWLKRSEAHRL